MKRKFKLLLLAIVATIAMTSCGSLSSMVSSPDFQEGFRQGWNTTAPEQYRY
ncbi:MAG: hypothetical protein J1F10_06925 [Muribaculaceae bacterium]|nr:hypothetical protein [Muribaculaceae bacterium]